MKQLAKIMHTVLSRLLKKCAVGLLICYKWVISPLLPSTCRFYPSCSEYAKEAFQTFGFYHALRLTARRLFHCSGFSKKWPHGGVDPVPHQHPMPSTTEKDL